jgi:hypothetical protein
MTEKDKIEIPVKRGKEKVRNRKRGTYERGRHREGEGRDIGCQVKGGEATKEPNGGSWGFQQTHVIEREEK